MDLFSKDIILNASLSKYQRLALSNKGIEKIARKYKKAYGEEFPLLLADLKSKQMTPRVKSMLWGELSDHLIQFSADQTSRSLIARCDFTVISYCLWTMEPENELLGSIV